MMGDERDTEEAARHRNRLRQRALDVSRAARELFFAYFLPRRWAYRFLFLVPGHDKLKRASELVLHDLGQFCFANRTTFSSDPYLMGVREGRRQAWLRIANSLGLDERQVQKLMEIDDGTE